MKTEKRDLKKITRGKDIKKGKKQRKLKKKRQK